MNWLSSFRNETHYTICKVWKSLEISFLIPLTSDSRVHVTVELHPPRRRFRLDIMSFNFSLPELFPSISIAFAALLFRSPVPARPQFLPCEAKLAQRIWRHEIFDNAD